MPITQQPRLELYKSGFLAKKMFDIREINDWQWVQLSLIMAVRSFTVAYVFQLKCHKKS